MLQRIGWVFGAVALAFLLWFFLRASESRGGARPERVEAPAEGRPPAELAPAASAPLSKPATAAREVSLAREATATPSRTASAPAHRLQVRVRDESGAPRAEHGVRLELTSPARNSSSIHRATTQADGLATFDALEHDPLLEADDLTLRAQLDGLFVPAVEASAPCVPWPSQPLELVVPAHGSVLVSVLDEHGALLVDGRGEVELRPVRELQPGAQIWRENATLTAPLEQGMARFALVAPGLRLLAAYDGGAGHAPARVEFEGPRRADEETRTELRLAEPPGELRLRVLTPARTPLASAALEVGFLRVIGGGSFSSGNTRQTDADGGLVVPLSEPWNEGETRQLTLLHRPTEGAECRATVDLSRELPPAQRELGDVVLVERAVLVSGRVLDTEGQVAQDVQLSIEHSWGDDGSGETFWGSAAWSEVRADGSFAFYDELSEPLRLTVDSSEYEPLEPLPFTPGTRGLELVLRRGVSLRGSVLLPEGLSPLAIGVAAIGANERERRSTALQASRQFELTGLVPGTYDIEFSLRPTEERVLSVPGVVARAGDARDPRLVDVDLSGLVRVVRLGVRTSEGALAAGGWVHVLGGERDQEVAFVIEAGLSTLLVPVTGSDVEVNVPGHRLLTLERLVADREVRLEPAFRVRYELAPGVSLPADGSLQLRLESARDDGHSSSSYALYRGHEQAGWFNTAFGGDANTFSAEHRTLEVEVPAAGTYDAVFYLVRGNPDGGRISFTLRASGPGARITLDDSSSGATFVVAPDATEYAEYLGRK